MKKITLITTGGTIGSTLKNGAVSVDTANGLLQVALGATKTSCELTMHAPINKNSESIGPSDWKHLLDCLIKANASDADGIVVTHGTDTMASTIAAVSAYSHLWRKKICFTGSFYPLGHPLSDAARNMTAAIELASGSAGPGVYLAFGSNEQDGEVQVIRGAEVKPMAFDEQVFRPVYGGAGPSVKSPELGISKVADIEKIKRTQSNVACISLYPGIGEAFPWNNSNSRDVMIVQMYHSGTGPSSEDALALINFIKRASPDITVLLGAYPKRLISDPYESTVKIKEAGGHIYADLQPHFLHAFSVLGLSAGLTMEEIIEKLSRWEL